MNNKKCIWIINKRSILLLFILFMWLLPERIINSIPANQYLTFILRGAFLIVLLRKQRFIIPKLDFSEMMIFLFFMSYVPGMILNGNADAGKYLWLLCDVFCVFGIWLFFKNPRGTLQILFFDYLPIFWIILLILSFFYAATNVAHKSYGGVIFFVGSKDITAHCLVTFFGLNAYSDVRHKGRITMLTWILAGFSLLFAVLQGSGQGMVMIGFLIGLLLFFVISTKRSWKLITPAIFIAVLGGIYYFIVTFDFLNVKIITNFIENVLQKDTTLTGRDTIYKGSLKLIMDHIFIGYGYGNQIVYETLGRIWKAFNTAHNALLQMLLDSGLIGTIIFCIMLYSLLKKMFRGSSNAIGVIYLTIFSLMLGGLTGITYPSVYFWLLVIIGISYSNFSDRESEELL